MLKKRSKICEIPKQQQNNI